jgi:hypothetical protein
MYRRTCGLFLTAFSMAHLESPSVFISGRESYQRRWETLLEVSVSFFWGRIPTDRKQGGLFVACMFFYLHLFQEPPISIDGVYYEQIPAEALHPTERGDRQHHQDLDGNGKKRTEIEDRV